jgi:hypothetical protein
LTLPPGINAAPSSVRRRYSPSHCASVAHQNGKARLTLNTSEGNATAQRFYEAIGFARLPDMIREDGSTLRAYELTPLPPSRPGG